MKKDTVEKALDALDAAYIEDYLAMQETLSAAAPKKPALTWVRLIPIAAVLAGAVLLGTVLLLPALRREPPLPPPMSDAATAREEHEETIHEGAWETDAELSYPETLPPMDAPSDESFADEPLPPMDAPSVESIADETEVFEEPSPLPGEVTVLTPGMLTSGILTGTSVKETGDPNTGTQEVSAETVPPHFPVDARCFNLTARPIELLPHVYETLADYGSVRTIRYRLLKMAVLDPLDSGMSGEFYYAMPVKQYVDVLRYDALLISILPASHNVYRDLSTNELTAFSAIFTDVWDAPQYWHMLPFTDGVFDESIFGSYTGTGFDEWYFHYRNNSNESHDWLDPSVPRENDWNKYLLVYHGSTYEEAIAAYKSLRAEYNARPGVSDTSPPQLETDFTSPEALAAMAYAGHLANGVFDCSMREGYFSATRYINGCPTNERILINRRDGVETVTHENRFEAADMEMLPDVAGYVESLELSAITPSHVDFAKAGEMAYCSAAGWYEKTADGVECFIKIYWIYVSADDPMTICRDDAYMHLTAEGATFLSRDEVRALIGNSPYISNFEQGEWQKLMF